MTLFRASGLMLLGRLLGQAMEALSHFVLARGLGPSNYGLYRVLLEGAQGLSGFARLGLDSAASVLIPRYQAERESSDVREVVRLTLTLSGVAGLLLGVGAWGFAPWLAVCCVAGLQVQALHLAAPLIPLLALLLGAGTVTRGFQVLLPQVTTVYLIYPGVKLLLVAVLLGWGLLGGLGATGLAAAVAAGVAVGWLVRLVASTSPSRPRHLAGAGKTLASTAWPLFLGDLLSLVVLRISIFLLAVTRSAEEVGVYGVALQIANQLLFIGEASVALMTPKAAWHWTLGERTAFRQLLQQARRAALVFCVPTLAVIFLFGRPLLALLGPAYREAYSALLILAAGHALAAVLAGAGWGLIASGRVKWWLADLAMAAVGHVVAALVLIPPLGTSGAALAQAGSLVGLYLVAWRQVSRLVRGPGSDGHPGADTYPSTGRRRWSSEDPHKQVGAKETREGS